MTFYYIIYTLCPVIGIAALFIPAKETKPETPSYPPAVDWLLSMD